MFWKIKIDSHRQRKMNQTKATSMENWRTRSWKQSENFQLVAPVAGKSDDENTDDFDNNNDDLNHDDDVGIDKKINVQENEEVHGTPSLEESHQSGQISKFSLYHLLKTKHLKRPKP